MTPLITQAELERRIGADRARQLLDDDRDGQADQAAFEEVIQEASDVAGGELLGAFSQDQIVRLAAADRGLRGAVILVALGVLGERRPEFVDPQGRPLFAGFYDRGVARLKAYRSTASRIAAEEKEGQNLTMGTRLRAPRGVGVFSFVPTRRNPKAGGGF